MSDSEEKGTFRPLRIWPAVLLVILLIGMRVIPSLLDVESMRLTMVRIMGPAACALLIFVWWVFLSRASLREKGIGLAGLLVIGALTTYLSDKSLQGFGTIIHPLPWGLAGFAGAMILCARMPPPQRTWLGLLAALVSFGYWDAVRIDGIWGDMRTSLSWRWDPTVEAEFLTSLADRTQLATNTVMDLEPLADPEWPAFRGPNRDGVQPDVSLQEDWGAAPPTELWRIRIGPGWASFSVAGDRLFTQEQRGDNEVVACYEANSGSELWVHEYESRFWEAVGGAGPRATPTIDGNALYALGAEGLLFRLDPLTGTEVWRRDLRDDASRQPPTWGFSSSPLVVEGLVIVHAGGANDRGVIAYSTETGELQWGAPAGDHSYSSAQLSEIGGAANVLMLSNRGLTLIDPTDGSVIGEVEWAFDGYRVVQPLLVGSSSVLIGTTMGTGTRRVELSFADDKLTATEAWTSKRMSPAYNDYVRHEGYLYGFDNNIFACIDLTTGDRMWKRGRYGNGQVVLLPTDDQLLVISETGELVLLRADPQKHTELARWPLFHGKTWNHPVLVGDRLYARNGEEAACLQMPIK